MSLYTRHRENDYIGGREEFEDELDEMSYDSFERAIVVGGGPWLTIGASDQSDDDESGDDGATRRGGAENYEDLDEEDGGPEWGEAQARALDDLARWVKNGDIGASEKSGGASAKNAQAPGGGPPAPSGGPPAEEAEAEAGEVRTPHGSAGETAAAPDAPGRREDDAPGRRADDALSRREDDCAISGIMSPKNDTRDCAISGIVFPAVPDFALRL